MEILIVRHAEPDYSIDSLTAKGWKEAELLSAKLEKMDIKDFYCSPLGRARDTASVTLKKMNREAEVLDWLREFDEKIKLEGDEKEYYRRDFRPSYWTNVDEYFLRNDWYKTEVMQAGSAEAEYRWISEGIDALLQKHGYVHEGNHFKVVRENHDRIVLFCHYGVCGAILAHMLGVSPVIFWHCFVAAPTSITTLVTEEREQGTAIFRMMSYGDTGHLYAAGEEPSFAARFCECFHDKTRH